MKRHALWLWLVWFGCVAGCQNEFAHRSLSVPMTKIKEIPNKKPIDPAVPAIAAEDVNAAKKTGSQVLLPSQRSIIDSAVVTPSARVRLQALQPKPEEAYARNRLTALFRALDVQIEKNQLLLPKNNNAISTLNTIKKADPNHPDIFIYRDKLSHRLTEVGSVLYQTGKTLSAKTYLKNALLMNPGNERAKQLLDALNPSLSMPSASTNFQKNRP